MKVYLCFEHDYDLYSITREWTFESDEQAKAFCEGLNIGLEKGRCDYHKAILENDLSIKVQERDILA